MSEKLKQLLIEKYTEQLNQSDNEVLANLAQDHNDKVGSELLDALKCTTQEYEQGIISHLSLLKQTEGICADFKKSLIDVDLFAEYIK